MPAILPCFAASVSQGGCRPQVNSLGGTKRMCGCFACTCGSDQIPFGNPLCVSRVTFRPAVQEYHQRIFRAWSERRRHVQVVRQTVGIGSILVERIKIPDRSDRIADLFQPPPLLYGDQLVRIFARSVVCCRSKGAPCDRQPVILRPEAYVMPPSSLMCIISGAVSV